MGCDLESRPYREPQYQWILEGRQRPLQVSQPVDLFPSVWLPQGRSLAVVGRAGVRGVARMHLPMTGLPAFCVVGTEASTCCGSREVLVARGAFLGMQAVIHGQLDEKLVLDLRRLQGQPPREVAPTRNSLGFQLSELELGGFYISGGIGYALWRGLDGYVHGFERVSSLRTPARRQVAERVVGNGERQALLILGGQRAVGFAATPPLRAVLGAGVGLTL